jgi:hypothetical protein
MRKVRAHQLLDAAPALSAQDPGFDLLCLPETERTHPPSVYVTVSSSCFSFSLAWEP